MRVGGRLQVRAQEYNGGGAEGFEAEGHVFAGDVAGKAARGEDQGIAADCEGGGVRAAGTVGGCGARPSGDPQGDMREAAQGRLQRRPDHERGRAAAEG